MKKIGLSLMAVGLFVICCALVNTQISSKQIDIIIKAKDFSSQYCFSADNQNIYNINAHKTFYYEMISNKIIKEGEGSEFIIQLQNT